MKKKQLISLIMYFICAVIWTIVFIMDLQRQSTIALQILHALCAVVFWASAILQYLSYRKLK